MAYMKRAKWFVATGIAMCVTGLAFIAMNGAQAFSQDHSRQILTGYSVSQIQTADCILVKGSSNCLADAQVASVLQ